MIEMNNLTLQKLVDNELNQKELDSLIDVVESDDQQGRLVAMAFIEKQLFDRVITQEMSKQVPDLTKAKNGTPDKPSRSRRMLVAMAASVGFALLVGFVSGQQFNQPQAIGSAGAASSTEDSSSNRIVETEQNFEFDEQALEDALARSWTPVPLGFKRELLRGGYVLQEQQRFTKVSLPGGDTIDVPIRKVNIEYLGQATIQ